jgi:hypothetical protein
VRAGALPFQLDDSVVRREFRGDGRLGATEGELTDTELKQEQTERAQLNSAHRLALAEAAQREVPPRPLPRLPKTRRRAPVNVSVAFIKGNRGPWLDRPAMQPMSSYDPMSRIKALC